MLLTPQQVIADYKIIKALACSKRSEVYLVTDQQQDKPLAMKLCVADINDQIEQDLFSLEIRILQTLAQDPHIAKLSGLGEYEKRQYFLMHYYPTNLLHLLNTHTGGIAFNVSIEIIEQVLRALLALHKRDILHLDIKPENVLMDHAQQVFLADFNNAYVMHASALYNAVNEAKTSYRPRISPHYASPELKDIASHMMPTRYLSRASDLYSVGMLWFQMLSGKTSFSHTNLFAILDNVAPKWAVELIIRLLNPDPQQRPQEIDECLVLIHQHKQSIEKIQFDNQTTVVDINDISNTLNHLRVEIKEHLLRLGKLDNTVKQDLCLLFSTPLKGETGQ